MYTLESRTSHVACAHVACRSLFEDDDGRGTLPATPTPTLTARAACGAPEHTPVEQMGGGVSKGSGGSGDNGRAKARRYEAPADGGFQDSGKEQKMTSTQLALRERMKELNCLYGVTTLFTVAHTRKQKLPRIMRRLVALLPDGWLYPDVTVARLKFLDSARINLAGITCGSSLHHLVSQQHYDFPAGEYPDALPQLNTQSAAITCQDVVIGELIVAVTAPRPDGQAGEGPFLREERDLLDEIAAKASAFLSMINQQDLLKERMKELACLHSMSQLSLNRHAGTLSMEDLCLQLCKKLVPQSWQFPRFCEAQVSVHAGDMHFEVCSPGFNQCKWTMQAPIQSAAEGASSFGNLTVGYREGHEPSVAAESDPVLKSPFLLEEDKLIKSIAKHLWLLIHSHVGDALLHSMLPPSIAEELRLGSSSATAFPECSILFTDIVGFTRLSGSSSPEAIFRMLNDLYTKFDSLVRLRGDLLYKVETIGDAYMVASGLPYRTGPDVHAGYVAQLAVDLIKAVDSVSITLKDGTVEKIRIRVGVHSGAVLAGVVGKINPRYCLFGDTVNVASRMESNSLPMQVHISSACHASLLRLQQNHRDSVDPHLAWWLKNILESRGEIEVKGKGLMYTYWLKPVE